MQISQYKLSKIKETIEEFSFFVGDAANSDYFALKASLKHYMLLSEIVDIDYIEEINYLKSLL